MGSFDMVITVETDNASTLMTQVMENLSDARLATWLAGPVDQFLRARAQARFSGQGSSEVGGPWAPLRDATVAIRESKGFPGARPINERTGQLRDLLTSTPGRTTMSSGFTGYRLPGPDVVGDLADKLSTAQIGTDNPRTVPRPVLATDAVDLEFLLVSLLEHVLPGV